MNISVIIPMYNEEACVCGLVRELLDIRDLLPGMEILLVDDGSTDHTWEQIESVMKDQPLIRGIRCGTNRGQSAAMLTGLHAAGGDVLVTMDGDLQNNPIDIPRLVALIGRFDVACGYRAKRKDTWARRMASRLGNTARNWVTRDGMRDAGCSLKAFRRECVADLPPLRGVHRFMPAYFNLNGRTMTELAVDHRPRTRGTSKYTNLQRLPRTVFDLIGFAWYRSRLLRIPPLPGSSKV
jgi:dolichol-phosphate mannosyltransferase